VRVNGGAGVSPIKKVLATLKAHGAEPRPFGAGYTARCLGDEHGGDTLRRLYVVRAEDGCVLAHCFDPYSAEVFLRAAGVEETIQ
jgi:hypothetical protein